jgi:hypothetical protein
LLDTLESHAKSGEPLDIQHEFQKLTFDIIGAYRPALAIDCVWCAVCVVCAVCAVCGVCAVCAVCAVCVVCAVCAV